MSFISKSGFVSACVRCNKYAWLEQYMPEQKTPVDEFTQSLFDNGHKVGELAKQYFNVDVDVTVTNEDGTPNTSYFFKHDTISTNMPDSHINAAGEKVFVPKIDTYYESSQSNARTSDFIAVIDNNGKYIHAVDGRTYNFIIKYKVLKLNDAGTHAAIGFGRASTADGKTVPILSKKITAASSEWQYFTGKLPEDLPGKCDKSAAFVTEHIVGLGHTPMTR